MKKVLSIIALLIILVLIGVSVGYLIDNDAFISDDEAELFGINTDNRTSLTLYSDTPVNRILLLDELEYGVNHMRYNRDTVVWMKYLHEKEIFMSNKGYVIMNKNDAGKIHSTYPSDIETTDTYNEYYIDCVVVENRSLGGINPENILLVRDVKYLGNQTFYYEV